jgi:alpha-tubulin suppressor-like RCC1 family protein
MVSSTVPVAVSTSGVLSGKTVTAIGVGYDHACAIASGKAYCWGTNSSGQLGNGTMVSSTVPVAVNTSGVLSGKTVTAIGTGTYATCAVASGQAYCWGYNFFGELGNGTGNSSTVPVAVNTSGVLSGKTVTVIGVGDSHTCAVASGQAYCWGTNWSGQLGNGTTFNSNVPVAVSTSGILSGKMVTAIGTGGQQFACAIASGQAYCWGFNAYGQLGNGTRNSSTVPVAVIAPGVPSTSYTFDNPISF